MADYSAASRYDRIQVVPRPAYKRELVEKALGKSVADHVQSMVVAGKSLTDIAWDISEQTRIRVSVENLRDWLGRNAPPSDGPSR